MTFSYVVMNLVNMSSHVNNNIYKLKHSYVE